MKNIRVFLSENFQFLEVKFSVYLNRRDLVMLIQVSMHHALALLFLVNSAGEIFGPCIPQSSAGRSKILIKEKGK